MAKTATAPTKSNKASTNATIRPLHDKILVRRDEADGLFSEVLGDGYVRLDDPETAALVAAAETRVREAVGLPL